MSTEDKYIEKFVIWETIEDTIKKRLRSEVREEEKLALVTTCVDQMGGGVSHRSVNNQEASNQEASCVVPKDDFNQKIVLREDTSDEEPVIWDMIKKLVKQKGRIEKVVAVPMNMD